jgi:hypothetical protein
MEFGRLLHMNLLKISGFEWGELVLCNLTDKRKNIEQVRRAITV